MMARSSREEFWALICDFRPAVIALWSISLVLFVISLVLLLANATGQNAILVVNLVILGVALSISLVILVKCNEHR
jgi:hypothetical protein